MVINDLIQNNPRISIAVFSFLVTASITTVTYFLTDQKRLKEIKTKQKSLKAEIKKYKGNPEKMIELNKELMEDMPEQLKLSMKPLLVTIIPILIFFAWLRNVYSVTPLAVKVFLFPNWLWWYLIFSIVFSISLRKIFGLQ